MFVQPLEGTLGQNSLPATTGSAQGEGALIQGGVAPAAGDNISRFVPPWFNRRQRGRAVFGRIRERRFRPGDVRTADGRLAAADADAAVADGLRLHLPYGSGNCSGGGNERYFQNASGSSEGDPHLSFNGSKWNSMASQPDLLNSDSFAGGFQISTQATPPNGKGVTWNQSATVSLNNGATTITMNDGGQPSITSNGQQISIARGQTLQLGDGESVTYEQNGSLRVCAQNGQGGRIDTTLTPNGDGVNVDVTAHDVDLGGALVNGFERRRDPDPQPGPVPIISNPIIGPISNPSYPAPPIRAAAAPGVFRRLAACASKQAPTAPFASISR